MRLLESECPKNLAEITATEESAAGVLREKAHDFYEL